VERYRQLLDIYTLEEILEIIDVEPEDVLALLDDEGLLKIEVEPL
jgi:hypothetical protein